MSFPVDDIADALVSRIKTARANFSPALKVVDLDQFWNLPRNLDAIQASLPCVIVQLDPSNFSVDNNTVVQPYAWNLNYLYPLTGKNRINPLHALRLLAELFTAGEHLDEISELTTAIGEAYLVDCQVRGMALSSALDEHNIGWALLPLTITVLGS